MNEETLKKEGEILLPKKSFSTITLTILMFLLPIIFIPSILYPFQVYKYSFLVIGIIIAVVALLISRLKATTVSVPTIITIVAIATPILYVLSSFITQGVNGVLGMGFDVHGSLIVVTMFALLFATIASFKNNKNALYAYLAFFGSFMLVAVFHLLRIFVGQYVGMLGLTGDLTSNTVGKWNDLSVFLGLGTVLTLITFEFLALPRLAKIALYIANIFALILIAINGFISVWIVLGITAACVFMYGYLKNKKDNDSNVSFKPYFSIAVMVIAVLFAVGGTAVNGWISEQLNISYVEARPSLTSTFTIVSESMKISPFFGLGQNGFSNLWLQFKPDGVNQTVFWNTDFLFGFGLIPTLFVTSGIVGALPWVLFMILFLFLGIKLLRTQMVPFTKYIAISSFVASIYLWLFLLIYIPSLVTFALTFFFTGITIATMYQQKLFKQQIISIGQSSRMRIAHILSIICIGILIAGMSYMGAKRVFAALYFQNSVIEIGQNGNIDQALLSMIEAIKLEQTDFYFRALAQLDNAKIQQVISQNKDNTSEEFSIQLQNMLAQTVSDAQQAVTLDPNNYMNHLIMADLYSSLVPVPGAYDNAFAAYKKTIELNPKNPGIRLSLARLEIVNEDFVAARKYIDEALQLKSNYTEAIFLLSQIEIEEGNLSQAIKNVESITTITPNDPTVFFQLGFLKYNAQDYDGAIVALEKAVIMVPTYSNAKYFLGLSYSKKGRVDESIAQFNNIKTLNPDNEEVDLILANLNAGRAPFTGVQAPLDDAPEKRDQLPIQEEETLE